MFNKCALPPRVARVAACRRRCLLRARTHRAAARFQRKFPPYRRMTEQCFKKCVATYKEEALSVGEATCVDRCVHKYMTVHGKVQEILGQQAAQAQAAQAAMGAMG